jgi:hypothetical protein
MPACKLRSVSKSNDRISGSRACSTMWKYLFAMYRYTLSVYVCLCVYRFYNAILFFVNMLPSEIYPAILYWTSWKQVVENNCGNIGMTDQLFTMHVTQLLQYRTTRGNRCLVCIVEFLWQTWGSISEFIFERAQLFRCCGSPRVRDARPGANHLDHDGHPSRLQRIAFTCRQAIQANLQEYIGSQPSLLKSLWVIKFPRMETPSDSDTWLVYRQRSMQRAETRWRGRKGHCSGGCGLSSRASGPTVRHSKANDFWFRRRHSMGLRVD